MARCLSTFPVPESSLTEQMLLREDGGWLRVHVSKVDHWLAICQGGPRAPMASFGTNYEPATADELTFYGGLDSVFKAHLLVGHMPAGATQIAGAVVTATDSDSRVIKTAAAPNEQT